MNLSSTCKPPTQVTCAHCQGASWCETFRSRVAGHFVSRAAHYSEPSGAVNHLGRKFSTPVPRANRLPPPRADKHSVIDSCLEVVACEAALHCAEHTPNDPMQTFSLFGASFFIAVLACPTCAAPPRAAPSPTVTLNGQSFTVEIASTPAEQEHGLMNRPSMAADHGMLFVFPDAEPRTFWMKNTLIPLDILFFDDSHRLITTRTDVPPCKANPCPLYSSTAPARYVLELNAGTAAKLGARMGDVITLSDMPSGTQ